jgi:ApeA N-terminal domain 1
MVRGKIVEVVKMPEGRHALQIPRESELLIDVSSGVQLRIVRCILPSSGAEEYSLRPGHQLWLHFHTRQKVCDVADWWVPWIIRLMSLLVGDPVTWSKIDLFTEDPYAADSKEFVNPGTVLRRGGKSGRKPKNVSRFGMLAAYPSIANDFEAIVKRWFCLASELEPVVDLFSTVAFHSHLHSQAEFLFLVQALEVYHARMFGGRDKHLDERLKEIFERHNAEARRLFRGIAELPVRIQYTRNHLTHYSKDTDSPKYLKPEEMVQVSWYMRVFIWICLLKEIGISGQSIERLIKRYGDAEFVNL